MIIGEIDRRADGTFFVPVWNVDMWDHYTVKPTGEVLSEIGVPIDVNGPTARSIRRAIERLDGRRPVRWIETL